MSFINYNGKIYTNDALRLPYANSAFRYGSGLIETMLIQEGRIRLEQLHWRRLWGGMATLNFPIPERLTQAYLANEVGKVAAKNNLEKLCRARVHVFVQQQGLYEALGMAEFVIECFELNESVMALNENGLVCGIADGVCKSNDMLANLKSSNMLIYQQAAKMAMQQKWNDAFILNAKGNIIESAIANVFWVKGGQIFTPPLSEGCVDGVMRRHVINYCVDEFHIDEKPLTPAALKDADEVFLTNTIRRIKWVSTMNNRNYTSIIASKLSAFLSAGF